MNRFSSINNKMDGYNYATLTGQSFLNIETSSITFPNLVGEPENLLLASSDGGQCYPVTMGTGVTLSFDPNVSKGVLALSLAGQAVTSLATTNGNLTLSASTGSVTIGLSNNLSISSLSIPSRPAGVACWNTFGSLLSQSYSGASTDYLDGTGAFRALPSSLAIPISIANGGTNSTTSLSNNRIMVSSAGKIVEAGALLNGQFLIGSTGGTPLVSTVTGGTNIDVALGSGQILVSVSGVISVANGGTNSNTALVNNRIMVSSGSKIVEGPALTNGQLLIGSTGAAPSVGSITAGAGLTITPGAGSISIGLNASQTFNSLNLSGLIGNRLLATNPSSDVTALSAGSSNQVLTGSLSWSSSPTLVGLNLSGLVADRLVVTSGGKDLVSLSAGTVSQVLLGNLTWGSIVFSISAGVGINISGTGSVTISTSQDINTTASPTFAGLTTSGEVIRIGSNSNGSVCLVSNFSATTTQNLRNTFVGRSGNGSVSGSRNVAVGCDCLVGLTSGNYNICIGDSCAPSITTGSRNTIIAANGGGGWSVSNPTLSDFVQVGMSSGSGSGTTIIGSNALNNNTGANNTAVGSGSGTANSSGVDSVFIGMNAGYGTSVGACSHTVCVGANAMRNLQSGQFNVALGSQSMYGVTTGNSNICIGYRAGASAITTQSNQLFIHNSDQTSANSLIWGDFAQGHLRINNNVGIATAPLASTRLGISTNSNMGIDINQYPTFSSGSPVVNGVRIYANTVGMSGSTNVAYRGIYSGETSALFGGACSSAHGGFFVKPSMSTSAVNNVSLYAADLAVGNTLPGSNLPTDGLYVQGVSRLNGGIRLGSGTETMSSYGHIQTSGGLLVGGGFSLSFNPYYTRIGNICVVSWPEITLTGANNTAQIAVNDTAFGIGSHFLSAEATSEALITCYNTAIKVCRVRLVKSGGTMSLRFTVLDLTNWGQTVDPVIYAGSLTYRGV